MASFRSVCVITRTVIFSVMWRPCYSNWGRNQRGAVMAIVATLTADVHVLWGLDVSFILFVSNALLHKRAFLYCLHVPSPPIHLAVVVECRYAMHCCAYVDCCVKQLCHSARCSCIQVTIWTSCLNQCIPCALRGLKKFWDKFSTDVATAEHNVGVVCRTDWVVFMGLLICPSLGCASIMLRPMLCQCNI